MCPKLISCQRDGHHAQHVFFHSISMDIYSKNEQLGELEMTKYFVRFESAEIAENAPMIVKGAVGENTIKSVKQNKKIKIVEVDESDKLLLEAEGATFYEDVQFAYSPPENADSNTEAAEFWRGVTSPLVTNKSLTDVVSHVRADQAWTSSRGRDVTIAIIDTGICGTLQEFPAAKRSPVDIQSAYYGQHWTDIKGHGSMCATIAGATNSAGGRYNGIAPDSTILSVRSDFLSTDLFTIFEELMEAKLDGRIPGPLVISNSYGLYLCSAPAGLPEDHPFLEIVLEAIAAGIFVVFAAGNNHYDVNCNHNPADCHPNTIWGINSHDLIMSVGTVNEQETNQSAATPHANSSRGPGQWARQFPKPDCVAPTYGEVVWGCGYQKMDWWGTSGACPQVAGLAALILSKDPSLQPAKVAQIIRDTCKPLAAAATCVGAGLINCEAALHHPTFSYVT